MVPQHLPRVCPGLEPSLRVSQLGCSLQSLGQLSIGPPGDSDGIGLGSGLGLRTSGRSPGAQRAARLGSSALGAQWWTRVLGSETATSCVPGRAPLCLVPAQRL